MTKQIAPALMRVRDHLVNRRQNGTCAGTCRWLNLAWRRDPMGFYQERILPHLVSIAMRNRKLVPYRERVIPAAAGRVLEMGRVLKPNGQLLFVEHGLSPDERVRKWQDWLTPAWKRIGGGCHLNRPMNSLIEQAGYRIERLETGYMAGPKPMTFMYEGSARLR